MNANEQTERAAPCSGLHAGDVSKLYGKITNVEVITLLGHVRALEITFADGRKLVRGMDESMILTSPRRVLNARMEWVLP